MKRRIIGLVTLSLFLPAGCGGDELNLIVDVRTDLRPVVDFAAVETELLPELPADSLGGTALRAARQTVTTGDAFLEGRRVAELEGVAAGDHVLRVNLLDSRDAVVATRIVLVELRENLATTVVISRDCAAVICPLDGDPADAVSCVGGRCQSPDCEASGSCPTRECSLPGDCAMMAACALPLCDDGVCLYQPRDAECGASEMCDATNGCVPSFVPDGGGVDGGPGDTGPADTGPADTGPPDGGACGTFGPPTHMPEVSSSISDFGASLTNDGLTLLFTVFGSPPLEIFFAERPSVAMPFGAPARAMGLPAGSTSEPSPSADGATLYFATGTNDNRIYTASTTPTVGTFAMPAELPGLVNDLGDVEGPDVTADELVLVFDHAPDLDEDLYMATRARVGDEFDAPMPISELNTAGGESYPSISADGLEIFYQSDSPTGLDIMVATRPDRGSPFESARVVAEVSSPVANDADPDISYDGTTLFFNSDRPGGLGRSDLYFSVRTPCP